MPGADGPGLWPFPSDARAAGSDDPLYYLRLHRNPLVDMDYGPARQGTPTAAIGDMEEIDIWRTAQILIDAHGEAAWLEAAQRADQCLVEGNPAGTAVWKRVLQAVEELQRRAPDGPLN